jgi:SAM-dependent methyltransferase
MTDKSLPIHLKNDNHWIQRIKHWDRLGPPLKPSPAAVEIMTNLVGVDSQVLLLGVTKELYRAFNNITAVDRQPEMIEHLWLGNTPTKTAYLENWLTTNFPMNQFDGIIGDGSINMLEYPLNVKTMLQRCLDILKPGGVFAVRFFTRPDTPITRDDLLAVAATGSKNICAFNRMMLACIAAETKPLVANRQMYDLFNELFPDRDQLSAQSGWPKDLIDNMFDAYEHSQLTSSMMTRGEILDLLPASVTAHFVECADHDFGECCPVLTFTK